LRAWGVHQNLFASGEARVTTENAAIEAALQHPEVPLRRPIGSNDPFQLEPANLPKVPHPLRRVPAKPRAKGKPAPTPRPAADRTALDAAEAELHKLDAARKREEADFLCRQEGLDQARGAAQSAYVEARRSATAAVSAARKDYRSAGGKE
jgi:multidrug efflux pump subunit AcrA (membrane-fusion protein)